MSLDLDYSENEVNIDENLKTEKSSYVLDSDVTDHKSEINHYLAAKNRLREKYNSSYDKPRFLPEILGFQGHNGEVLLFEKSISIVENIEEWLSEVELEMKRTLSNILIQSVTNFAKQSLDE